MPFRQRFRAPVRTNKEIVDSVVIGVAAGTVTLITIASAVNDYIGSVGTLPIGGKIKAIWLETSYTKLDSLVGRLDWTLNKKPASVDTSAIIPGATGGVLPRKYIIFERKGLISNDGLAGQGGSPARFAGWIMIPKRFQNMAEGDTWQIRIGASVVYNFCVKVIYKWQA